MYHDKAKLEETMIMYDESIEMKCAIFGEKSVHPDIAATLDNLELVCQAQ